MKRTLTLIFLCISAVCGAQIRWINPVESGAEVHGQAWAELSHTYVRLPDEAQNTIRSAVWNLSRNSAGLNLVFTSNAPEIKVRYQVAGGYGMFHMPSTGVSGVDLFAIDENGKELWAAPDFPPSFADTISYRYSGMKAAYEYHLYLPLYNTVKWLEIGVPEGSEIAFVPRSEARPIVVYGTSIAQGACASRPGQAWTNILDRRLDEPVVNLGFSGNAYLESEFFDVLNQIDACMYIIDAMPNNPPKNPIFERTVDGVRKLRASHSCPIILVEHSGYPNELIKPASASFRESNAALRKAYEALVAEGVTDLYYVTHEECGYTMDEMVEGIHPNDIGMMHTADALEKHIRNILY